MVGAFFLFTPPVFRDKNPAISIFHFPGEYEKFCGEKIFGLAPKIMFLPFSHKLNFSFLPGGAKGPRVVRKIFNPKKKGVLYFLMVH